MQVEVLTDKQTMGRAAAAFGAERIRAAIAARGEARIVVATGASQFEMLDALTREADIDWTRVSAFHLDEYVNLPITHPASFRLYLWQRFISRLPLPLKAFHYLDGEGDVTAAIQAVSAAISAGPIDAAFVGIGENAHLAFNDPPADFETEAPYIIVKLDDDCRRQQVGEGWFPSLEAVPAQAISMSIRQILKAGRIICTVPDARKAEAVRRAVSGPVTPEAPASILQRHADTKLFLDPPAAAGLA